MCSGEPVKSIGARIQNLKKSLKDLLEPNFGLLDHLFSLSVVSRSEIAEIRSKQPVSKANACLLECLSSRNEESCQNFLTALERTNQTHIVNYIRNNGGEVIHRCTHEIRTYHLFITFSHKQQCEILQTVFWLRYWYAQKIHAQRHNIYWHGLVKK
jgi:hypothetical protein